ncbi:MAG: hypothetical protein O7E52_02805 [Candidatus Poribacteria bacterium]|nr:hypothetical protein [Candidatus Poribacteria bacterium]
MKQFFLCTVVMLIAVNMSFARIIDPETGLDFQYRAKLVEVAPNVDGFLDDPAWEEAIPAKLEQEVKEDRRWLDSDDFKGTFAVVWRNRFLYLAVQLTDDQIETHHEKLALQDRLELYLDIDHTGHKSDLYRYILPVGEDAPQSTSSRMMIAWASDGQSCELSFNLGYTPTKNEETIGFGIYYNDVDQGQLNHRFTWAPEGQTRSDDLADLVFTAELKLNQNQKAMPWGRIKSLY